jgi:hypothetical protein
VRRAFSNESVRRRFEWTIVLKPKAKAGYFASEQPYSGTVNRFRSTDVYQN